MAKATKQVTEEFADDAAKARAAEYADDVKGLSEATPFSIALAQPGEDIPDGGRRVSCPDCGAKHDVVRTDVAPGQGGTWTVPAFTCAAGCGFQRAGFPVH